MKTAKGHTYTDLLNFDVTEGTLYAKHTVPMSLGTVTHDDIDTMIPHINDRITTEKMPHATYEKCLEQIEHHRELYIKAIVKLIETYNNAVAVHKTRTSPAHKARAEMLAVMDDRMLKAFASNYVSEDTMADIILPDDRDALITATLTAMQEKD